MLSSGGSNDKGRHPPFLFCKGPESQAVTEAQQRLSCPVAGAVYVKKLTAAKPHGSEAVAKKRPKAPDLASEPSKKAARPKGKAKAKAKAKATAAPHGLEVETAESMQADVEYLLDQPDDSAAALPVGSRQRLWLDDLLAALQRCQKGPFSAIAQSKASQHLVSVLLSYGLEFAFTGAVRLQQAKQMKAWSQAPWFKNQHFTTFQSQLHGS